MANPGPRSALRLARKCTKVATRAAESLLSGSNGTCVTRWGAGASQPGGGQRARENGVVSRTGYRPSGTPPARGPVSSADMGIGTAVP
jgi:hypothetical protein